MLICCFHASGLGQTFPVSGAQFAQVGNLQCHTQAHLTQASLVCFHELKDAVLSFGFKLVAFKQHTIFGNLLDTQDLVLHGVQGQVQVMATTLQSIQVIAQFLRFHLVKLQVGDKDHTAFEVKLIWDAFAAKSGTLAQPRNLALLAGV